MLEKKYERRMNLSCSSSGSSTGRSSDSEKTGSTKTLSSPENSSPVSLESNSKVEIQNQKILAVPSTSNSFRNLTHLDIANNAASRLDLRSLARLEWLCCSNNQLEVLSLSGNSLTYLDCSNNNLGSISIEPIPNNLNTLQISFNCFEQLPPFVWIIPDLSVIYSSHNKIKQLDCIFQNSLQNLPIRELHLHCNKIMFVSKDFIQRASRNLKILNLSQNEIEHMPTFPKRSIIQELYLSRNRLFDNDERDALDFLEAPNLRRLYLAFNKIEHINDRFFSIWKNLEELILCGNRIKSLPSKLSSLSNLRVLRVHANRLESPPNLTKMPLLKVVDLSHNNLKKINLENLISGNLTYLDISCNDRLSLDPEKLNHSKKRPMNLVEVSSPKKTLISNYLGGKLRSTRELNGEPQIWELGFSELPNRNQTLSVTQYRDVSSSKEALFGIFDGGEGNPAPKTISKSIAKIYSEERNIEETDKFSLKFTLLNAIKSIRQKGNFRPLKGILCLLSKESSGSESPFVTLNIAMMGGIRSVLVENGKIRRLTDIEEMYLPDENSLSPEEFNKTIPDPKIISVQLTPSTEYLILASQSLWNHISEGELLAELETNRHKKSVLVAKRLTDMAQSHTCKESLSLIIVRFKWNFSSINNFIPLKSKNGRSKANIEYNNTGSSSDSEEYGMKKREMGISSPFSPDSAIETDRSSGSSSRRSRTSPLSPNQVEGQKTMGELKTTTRSRSRSEDVPGDEDLESMDGNTSISQMSQMSVEQFKCWEYMLEQNTKLLFKKELDSLSKGAMARNGKLRKSVHFPYQDINNYNNNTTLQNQEPPQQLLPPNSPAATTTTTPNIVQHQQQASKRLEEAVSSTAGFYTLSKAKSLSHLFENNQKLVPASSEHYYHTPSFDNKVTNRKIGVRERGTILGGGPNAAYFGNLSRVAPKNNVGNIFESFNGNEIQELKQFDSIEYDNQRLKQYWDSNKITEL